MVRRVLDRRSRATPTATMDDAEERKLDYDKCDDEETHGQRAM
jgi:hypothetical protein